MIELRCPESCQYLNSARSESNERENELRTKELAEEGRAPMSLSQRELALVNLILESVVEAHRGHNGPTLSNLIDAEIFDALENALKNIETETSGIIYEHHASTPRIEDVSRRIRAALDDLAGRIIAEQRPKRSEMIQALRFARDEAAAHIKRSKESNDSRAFLRNIALYAPWPQEETSRLIIPR
ncbi:MAG: hypothetical protein AB1631_29920 [Acidobacteriota bacterium]